MKLVHTLIITSVHDMLIANDLNRLLGKTFYHFTQLYTDHLKHLVSQVHGGVQKVSRSVIQTVNMTTNRFEIAFGSQTVPAGFDPL